MSVKRDFFVDYLISKEVSLTYHSWYEWFELNLTSIWIGIFLFTVFAAVNFLCLIGEKEDLVEFLLDGSDAAWVFAPDDILYLFWHVKLLFLYDLGILDDIDSDVVVNESENI